MNFVKILQKCKKPTVRLLCAFDLKGIHSMSLRFYLISANVAMMAMAVPVFGMEPIEVAPIRYYTAPVDDPVSRLQKRIDADDVTLHCD
jgi:hypothetical protein